MATHKLRSAPHLEKLLIPGESITYTAYLHPLYGVLWLLGALATLWLCYLTHWLWLIVPALALFTVYIVPFFSNEIAVTTHRLLLRYGRFNLTLDDIDPSHLDHYQLYQTFYDVWFGAGTIVLNLRSANTIHPISLKSLWRPFGFIEALTSLNPLIKIKS